MWVSRRALLRSAAAGYAGGRLLTGLAPISSARAEAPPAGPAWLKDVFRELHIDAHFGQVENPYADFRAEETAEILKNARFQMVSYFASCGAGYSYYPTGIGVPHPSLKRDFTGEMTKALKKRGIRVLPYVSVGPDRRFHQEHPDWISVRDPSKPTPETRNGAAQMCINSPWVDEAHIPQLKEIVSLYDVDGFFLDSLLGKFTRGPCYCKYCRAAFAREVGGEIPVSDSDPNVFAVHRWLSGNVARYADRVTAALAAVKPDLAFVFTHVWVSRNPVKPPASVTQLVWEPAPPYPGVHSLDFSMEARYLSTQPGIVNWSCMATRGNGWGDYSLRDPAAFQHEAAVLLASSGRPYLSDDSYPSGNPDAAVYQVYGDVNRRTEELEATVKGAAPVKDIAVLLSAHSIWSSLPLVPPREWLGGPSSPAVAGAHTALVETHAPFGILNSESLILDLAEYKALILADQCFLGDEECEAIRRFVRAGGALIATAGTGTRDARNKPLADFALADVLGIQYRGQAEVRRAFLRAGAQMAASGIPRMDVQVNGGHPRIRTTTASQLLPLVPAIGAKQAPADEPEGPAVTVNRFGRGRALYCALPIFRAYHQDGTPVLRKLAAWMLEQVHPAEARSLLLENAPVNVEVTYNTRGTDRFVHLLNYTGDKRMQGPQRLQSFSAVEGIQVRVRSDAKPKRVLLVPGSKPVTFEWRNGWIRFDAQPLTIHSVYRIES